MPSNYAWHNKEVRESSQRFDSLQDIYDPISIRHIERLGIREGWSCLEVGGGGGSLARWMSAKAGPRGSVLVTDIDTRFLKGLTGELGNVQVQTHDIVREQLPIGAFDLAHARLVLVHLPEREQALEKMVSSLKPGGWVLVEDFTDVVRDAFGRDYHPTRGQPPEMSTNLYHRLMEARLKVMSAHGIDVRYARRLYQLLKSKGLDEVGLEGHMTLQPGGSSGAKLERANFLQSKIEMLATGLVSEAEFTAAMKMLDDAEWVGVSPLMISAWGRKR